MTQEPRIFNARETWADAPVREPLSRDSALPQVTAEKDARHGDIPTLHETVTIPHIQTPEPLLSSNDATPAGIEHVNKPSVWRSNRFPEQRAVTSLNELQASVRPAPTLELPQARNLTCFVVPEEHAEKAATFLHSEMPNARFSHAPITDPKAFKGFMEDGKRTKGAVVFCEAEHQDAMLALKEKLTEHLQPIKEALRPKTWFKGEVEIKTANLTEEQLKHNVGNISDIPPLTKPLTAKPVTETTVERTTERTAERPLTRIAAPSASTERLAGTIERTTEKLEGKGGLSGAVVTGAVVAAAGVSALINNASHRRAQMQRDMANAGLSGQAL